MATETNISTIDTSTDQTSSRTELPPKRQLRRRVLNLAMPVIGENLLQTLLGIVDTILVAGLGVVALAGVGASLQVVFILIAAMSALSIGASVLIAQAFGANDMETARHYARQTLIWSGIISLPLTLLGIWLTPAIIALFGLEPDVAQVARDYLVVTMGSISAFTVMLLGSGVLRGVGDSRTPMLVTALANVFNVIVSYALIYGPLGLPALGAVGSAWGTLLSRVLGAALIIGVLWQGRGGIKVAGGRWWPQFKSIRGVLGIGFPAALEEVLVITAIATLTPIVATLGTTPLAAHRVVINVLSLSFLPGLGFGLAATALVGQSIGARAFAEARVVTNIALRWAMIWMGGLGLLFFFCAKPLMRIFTDDPAMIEIGAAGIHMVAFTQPLWAATFVYAGALRGTGDTRTPLIVSGTAMWAVAGLAFLLVLFVQQSLAAVWAAFLLLGPLEAACYWWIWRKRAVGRTEEPSPKAEGWVHQARQQLKTVALTTKHTKRTRDRRLKAKG